jgi:hypothetical protein
LAGPLAPPNPRSENGLSLGMNLSVSQFFCLKHPPRDAGERLGLGDMGQRNTAGGFNHRATEDAEKTCVPSAPSFLRVPCWQLGGCEASFSQPSLGKSMQCSTRNSRSLCKMFLLVLVLVLVLERPERPRTITITRTIRLRPKAAVGLCVSADAFFFSVRVVTSFLHFFRVGLTTSGRKSGRIRAAVRQNEARPKHR